MPHRRKDSRQKPTAREREIRSTQRGEGRNEGEKERKKETRRKNTHPSIHQWGRSHDPHRKRGGVRRRESNAPRAKRHRGPQMAWNEEDRVRKRSTDRNMTDGERGESEGQKP